MIFEDFNICPIIFDDFNICPIILHVNADVDVYARVVKQ